MKTKYKVLIHVIYWFYIINQTLSTVLLYKKEYPFPENYYEKFCWDTFLNIIAFYTVYFCLAILLKNKNKITGIIMGLLLIAATTAFRLLIDFIFWKYLFVIPGKEVVMESAWIYNELRLVVITGIYALLIRFTISLFETQKQKADLVNQTKMSELALLRSQINPHFLFNTLNNIYSLVNMKSADAPEAVMKLSSIMRYTLYDANTDKVYLVKEVEYLRSFIELQLLRFKSENFVEFNVKGDIERQTIAPMIFISFVENAFKHGSKKVNSPGIIINLEVNEKKTTFEVVNFIRENETANFDKIGGIGLHNIKRRLELLYKDKHKLELSQPENKFAVKLEIENK